VTELFVFYQAHLPDPPDQKIHFVPLRPRDISSVIVETAAQHASQTNSRRRAQSHISSLSLRSAIEANALASTSVTTAAAIAAVLAFDVRNAMATMPADKVRLLTVIEGSGDSIDEFNKWIREMVSKKLDEARNEGEARAQLVRQFERESRANRRSLSFGHIPLGAFSTERLSIGSSGQTETRPKRWRGRVAVFSSPTQSPQLSFSDPTAGLDGSGSGRSNATVSKRRSGSGGADGTELALSLGVGLDGQSTEVAALADITE
jgi:hypothetical protein